jgi:hypothetical protein
MTNVKRAVRAAYMLGKAGVPARNGMFDSLIARASEGDDGPVWKEIAALRREVAALRKEVEASRTHKTKVIALKRADTE